VASTAAHRGLWAAFLVAPALFPMWAATLLVVTIAAKWLLLGRLRPGAYPMWGWYFTRWWIVDRLANSCQTVLTQLAGTPLLGWYLRAMGMRISAGARVLSASLSDFDLISIGENSVIDEVSCLFL